MRDAKVRRPMAPPGPYGNTAVTRLGACLLAIAILLSACGKKGGAERGAGGTAGKAKAAGDSTAAATAPPGHAFDGFYIHRGYLDGLKTSRSIFKTRFPHGTVYLQIHGDSVVMDYSNHEGGNGRLRVDSGSGPMSRPAEGQMGGGEIVFRPQGGASALAWETGTDSAIEFIRLPKPIRTINQLYGRLLLDGVYRCVAEAGKVGQGRCLDTVVISGDSLRGLKGGLRRLGPAIDWLDNMPQMDFMEMAGADTASWAYTVSADKLEFFAIDLPKACKSLDDYDCPLTEAKPGSKVLELIRIGGAPAGSESRL
jgi:hypothetical protein